MFNNNLAVSIINAENLNIALTNINFENSILQVKNNKKTKLFSFYLKNFLLAIKKEKLKVSINNNIIIKIEDDYRLPPINNINIRQSYIATTKKEIINKTNNFIGKMTKLKDLISEEITPKIETISNEENIFVSPSEPFLKNNIPNESTTNFFDLNSSETVSQSPISNSNDNLNIPIFDMSNETNFKSEIKNPLEMPHELVKEQVPSQTISNVITNDDKMPSNSGHIKSKFVIIILIILFISASVFAVYEAINYLKVTGKI